MRFFYSVIRYVPDPVTQEFVNVGVIVGSDESSEWEVRQVENTVRARRMDDDGSLPAVWSFIDTLGRQVDAFETSIVAPELLEGIEPIELSEEWLRTLHLRHNNVVQLSAPAPLVAESAEEAAQRVFSELVSDPARRHGHENKHTALAAARRAYESAGLRKNENLFERAFIETGAHRERVDFAIANGRAVQLTQAWSFKVADQDRVAENVRSWGWTMRELQDHGGALRVGERRIEVPSDVEIGVLYVPPPADSAAMADAYAVFSALGSHLVPIQDAPELAHAATSLLGHAA